MDDKKIVVASVPFTDTAAPIMAPALFKGILNSAGFDCSAVDLNGQVYNKILNDPDKDSYIRFFYFEQVDMGFEFKIQALFEYMVEEILQHQPNIVCLSLLHYQCQTSAKWISFFLKKIDPSIEIIVGGAGAFGHGLMTNVESYTTIMQKQKLIDHYISGDGDIALVELIKGNVGYPGIDSMAWAPIEDLSKIAYPNYDDYDFTIYENAFLGVLGSRGCVRQCTFCDIHEYWAKYKWRTGEHIFEEILFQNKKYGIRYFKFQDSLINGNVKEYNKLITLLADHNRQNPDNTLHWASYFIFRPESQMPEKMWQLTAESGAFRLNVGIESLVEKNRDHIKKKFSNADIEYGMKMAKKYKLTLTFLMMVGYVTETEEDQIETLKWIEDNKHYANDPVRTLVIGGGVTLLPGTWIEKNQEQLGVTWQEGNFNVRQGKNHLWQIVSTGNNHETRMRRLTEIAEVGRKNGWNVSYVVLDPQKELENVIKEKIDSDKQSV